MKTLIPYAFVPVSEVPILTSHPVHPALHPALHPAAPVAGTGGTNELV